MRTAIPPRKGKTRRLQTTPSQAQGFPPPESRPTSLDVSAAGMAAAGAAAFMPRGTGRVPSTQLLAGKGVIRTLAARPCRRSRARTLHSHGDSTGAHRVHWCTCHAETPYSASPVLHAGRKLLNSSQDWQFEKHRGGLTHSLTAADIHTGGPQ